jgi:tRNA (guanosine-2'-O-)-methyltransferase
MTPERKIKIQTVAAKRQLDSSLVLENVHDPHNIGAIMRTCDAVGISEIFVILTDERISTSEYLLGQNSSSGSKKWVEVHIYRDVLSCFKDVRTNYDRIIGTKLGVQSRSLYEFSFTEPTALLFGNESMGLSELAYQNVDTNMYIPMMGMVRSLNISVACAISLYECLRQRNSGGFYTGDTPNTLLEKNYIEMHAKSPKRVSPKWKN